MPKNSTVMSRPVTTGLPRKPTSRSPPLGRRVETTLHPRSPASLSTPSNVPVDRPILAAVMSLIVSKLFLPSRGTGTSGAGCHAVSAWRNAPPLTRLS